MESKLTIVANLNVQQVSWAHSFCQAARHAGVDVVRKPIHNEKTPTLYIGDDIAWCENSKSQRRGYFLAAVDGTQVEAKNIEEADLTTTVSCAEQSRAYRLFGDNNPVAVDGFPIDFSELDEVGRLRGSDERKIGFIGRSDRDKGPELELRIATVLKRFGAKVVHISHTINALAADMNNIGIEVIECTSRAEYMGHLASLGCVINTSPRESLFVSGIEASRLGVPVISPRSDESGISDWNADERVFDADNPEEAAALALDLFADRHIDVPDVSAYAAKPYFQRILKRFKEAVA